jgi:methionyl-tRNA formyltransferase
MLPVAPSHPRRLVFLGTPAAAVPALRALREAGFTIPLVVSRRDARRGRGESPTPSPVKEAALDLGLDVTDTLDDVTEVDADLGVVVAYGRIIPTSILERVPMVNLHFSLLPRWRGAAPVERAILAGDPSTGVCVMRVEEGLDTGGIYASVELPIGPEETAADVRARLATVGGELLVRCLVDGLGDPIDQEGPPSYAEKLGPDDLLLDFEEPAEWLARVVRIGGAWTTFRGRRLKVWRAAVRGAGPATPGAIDGLVVGTGLGGLELVEVQPEGRARMDAEAWAHGARPGPDDRLGT